MMSRRSLIAAAGLSVVAWPLRAQPTFSGMTQPARTLRARTSEGPGALGYDGSVPGPTLQVKRGDELRVRLINDLTEPTSIHWHGVRLPNAMDGVPALTQPAIAPTASFEYRFRPPDAGTFWYHAQAASQADRGLYGALIVEESEPVDVDREIVLMLGMPGEHGEARLRVNGSLRPDIPAKHGERLRLRLINATSARGIALRLEAHAVRVMAIDGQPAEPFVARDNRVGLGPGSRIDLFVDMTREAAASLLAGNAGDEQPIARLVYEGSSPRAAPRREPLPLPPNPLPARIDMKNAHRVELLLAGAKPLDPAGPPLFTVRRGRAVTLSIRNDSGRPQVVHLHGHHFRLLDRLDDGWKPYWLDTLVVGDQIDRVAFVADNPGKWLIESRPLELPQAETAVWFQVTTSR
jgi:FtsP/CotA-like multicopper oxidase with cupredoxin domain